MKEPNKMATERAVYLLRTVAQYLEDNPVKEYTIFYDEAECDGYCLQTDCIAAADDLEEA